jgi:alkylation response protein AidB-like acyl-CoA dehydrogenase
VDGDDLVVNGQKIWTSFADVADYQELLVRTNTEVPKHRGLTWVICDMSSPGIEVRPIRTMDGGQEFCEVYYDDVRVPLANVVGGIDRGWSVAIATLSFERGTAFMLNQVQLADTLERLIDVARSGQGGRPPLDDEEIARDLAELRAEVAALKALTYMSVSRNMRSEMPGPEGSMLKLQWAELNKRVHRLAVEIIGPDALGIDGEVGAEWTHGFLQSFSGSIGGGTSEIMRNIIAERVLGLPR